jgi:hypothetical protein
VAREFPVQGYPGKVKETLPQKQNKNSLEYSSTGCLLSKCEVLDSISTTAKKIYTNKQTNKIPKPKTKQSWDRFL